VTASRLHFAAVVCAGVLVPAVASASNTTHPRTPVVWEDVACVQLHDRSEDATLHLPYTIAKEDLEVGDDEVADSRRHQFFGFCRPHHPQDFLPTWITQADVDAAVAVPELLQPGTVETDDILELNSQWDDCWFRINADDDRRPISFAMADAGVDWDTTDIPAGVYTLYGYTWEPVFNIWARRPGLLKVYDGDPHAVGPAVAITTGELTPYRDEEVMIEGCFHAIAGSTYTVYWALTPEPDVEPDWMEYLQADVPGQELAFAFTPPEAMWGESAMIRVDVSDPQGRSYTTYQADPMLVINESDPDACNDGAGFIGSPGCSDESSGSGTSATGADTSGSTGTSVSGSGESSAETSAATATTPGATADDGGGGETCACTTDSRPGAIAPLVLLVPLARRRRHA